MRTVLAVFAALSLLPLSSAPAGEENPLKNAKLGDWAVYSYTMSTNIATGKGADAEDITFKHRSKVVVTEKDENKIVLAVFHKDDDEENGPNSMEFAIDGDFDVPRQLRQLNFYDADNDDVALYSITATGKEKVTVPAGGFDCDFVWYSAKLSTKDNHLAVIRVFYSDRAPLGGWIKTETRNMAPVSRPKWSLARQRFLLIRVVHELSSFGSDAPLDDPEALWGGEW